MPSPCCLPTIKPSAVLQMHRASKALPGLKQPITTELTAQAGLSHPQHKPRHSLFDQLSSLHRHNHRKDRTGLQRLPSSCARNKARGHLTGNPKRGHSHPATPQPASTAPLLQGRKGTRGNIPELCKRTGWEPLKTSKQNLSSGRAGHQRLS